MKARAAKIFMTNVQPGMGREDEHEKKINDWLESINDSVKIIHVVQSQHNMLVTTIIYKITME